MDTETKKKVLVVEDDTTLLSALRTALETAGFEVLEAKDGAAGVAVTSAEHPDIILLDILMPVMDGWEMLRQLRESGEWGKCVPVVILTNLSADEDEQIRKVAELGPSYFMVKADWKLDDVVDKVHEILHDPKVPCA
jgi:DNA-binding response OmpR family regulator